MRDHHWKLADGATMRRLSTPTIIAVMTGLAIGLAFRYLVDDPSAGSLANYGRSGLHGIGIAATGWGVYLYFNSRRNSWLRKWPLGAEIVLRAIAIAVAVSTAAVLLQKLLYGQRLETPWLVTELPRIVVLAFVTSVLFCAIFELTRLIGGRVLLNIILGRYRHPTREDRVLMFLDIAGSTSLAEALGEVRIQELLTRFFFDIDGPIVAYAGEVHSYVGDEVIVTWPLTTKVSAERCLECFFAIENRIAEMADSYQREFGSVPRFRAALHAGPVVISECGDSHRQIAYFGDTLNVTQRLQEHCKAVGRTLLVSADLLSRVRPGFALQIEALGRATLRGRSVAVEVFAIERGKRGAGPTLIGTADAGQT
jgi:adenylate cyclase